MFDIFLVRMIILIHILYLSHFSQKHYTCDIPLSQR